MFADQEPKDQQKNTPTPLSGIPLTVTHHADEPTVIGAIESARQYIKKWLIAADALISELAGSVASQPYDEQKTIRAVHSAVSRFSTAREPGNNSSLGRATAMLGERGAIQRLIATTIGEQLFGGEVTGEQIATLQQYLNRNFIEALEQESWMPQTETHESLLTSTRGCYTSHVIPLNAAFGQILECEHFLQYETRGTPSAALKVDYWERKKPTPLLANGWLTTLANPDGEEILSLVRSASLVHYGINDEEIRHARTKNAAEELLLAIVAKKIAEGIDPTNSPIKIATFELQTRPEGLENNPNLFPEKRLIDEEYQALQALKGENSGMVNGGSLPLLVEHLYFNYPIHHIGFREHIGFSGEVALRNESAESTILQEAEGAVTKRDIPSPRRKKLLMLLNEIKVIKEGSPSEITDDPYRFNSRFINLAHLLGYTVHLNCRSGKDRTGIVDAEAKYVAEAIDAAVSSGDRSVAPDFQRAPSPLEQATIFHYAMESGSVLIQRHCTGVPGSLLQPIRSAAVHGDPLPNRIGENNWVYFRGLSQFAGA